MATCIAVVSDMIFSSRITATAKKQGTTCRVVMTLDALKNALESDAPELVLVDMNSQGVSAEESIRMVKTQQPTARVVAFFSHVQTELLQQAEAAGADDVWPRSAFVQRLPELLKPPPLPGTP